MPELNLMNDFTFKHTAVNGNKMGVDVTQAKINLDSQANELRSYINNLIGILNSLNGADYIQGTYWDNTKKTIQYMLSNLNSRFNTLNDIFNLLVINAGNSNAEIVALRHDNINNITYDSAGDRADAIASSLADFSNYVIYGSKFGISPNNSDNHSNIIAALNQLQANSGGTLLLPYGIIKTSPISFQGYKSICIKGVGRYYQLTNNTTIKIVGTNPSGTVGLQFADTKNPKTGVSDTWTANYCKLEGLYIDCDNKCDIGVNGNFGLALNDVSVRHANIDGIVLEDYTYPVFFTQVESTANGRHGIYVRGKMTTAFTFSNVSCSVNGGYGINIEGGSSASFRDCLVQNNTVGGLKINKVSGYTGNYFLNDLTFINFYTEGNGTLLNTDAKYEGNAGVYITGYDKTSASTGKPSNIRFIGGAINNSVSGVSLQVDSVWGLKIACSVGYNANIASTGVYGVEFETQSSSGAVPNLGSSSAIAPYYRTSAPYGIVYNGGVFANRGRLQKLEFYLTSITAGQTVNMKTIYDSCGLTWGKGYVMFKQGSILGLILRVKNAINTGTLTATPVVANLNGGAYLDPPNPITNATPIALNNTVPFVQETLTEGTANFVGGNLIGVQLTSSSNYVAGSDTAIVVEMYIEI